MFRAEFTLWVLNFNFLGLDLSNAPSAAFGHIMALDFSNMSVILLLLIPVLAVIASVISMKVTQAQTGQNQNTEGQGCSNDKVNESYDAGNDSVLYSYTSGRSWIVLDYKLSCTNSSAVDTKCFLDKKGEEIVVTVPEKKQQHRKKTQK